MCVSVALACERTANLSRATGSLFISLTGNRRGSTEDAPSADNQENVLDHQMTTPGHASSTLVERATNDDSAVAREVVM